MLLSKMHYAIELAALGNKVLFVNPPRPGNQKKLAVLNTGSPVEGITIIDTKEIKGSLFLRHKLFFVFKLLSAQYAEEIKKIAGCKINELWCFNPHAYMNLRKFEADKTILLLYDLYKGSHIFKVAETADAIVSVSQLILDYYDEASPPKLLLQHGLGKHFADLANERLKKNHFSEVENGKIKIGYVGNLFRGGIDMEAAKEIILQHADKEFHFWGPYNADNNNVGAKELPIANKVFIEFLQSQNNVFLHGIKDQPGLAREVSGMDAFLFLYATDKDVNAASNSHKILEYLSTGKVVISTYVSNYRKTDLLAMPGEKNNHFPELFNTIIADLKFYNSEQKQKQKIEFALSNTYSRQVDIIHKFIYKTL